VNEVIMGNVLSAGHGQILPGRRQWQQVFPIEVPAFGLNKVCGSGLKSVILGAQAIMLGMPILSWQEE